MSFLRQLVGETKSFHSKSCWRFTALLFYLTTLAGCTALSGAIWGTLKAATVGQVTSYVPTAAEVGAKPYFQLGVESRYGSGLMILGNVDHGREAWYDASGKILFIERGLIVKTWHFPVDRVDTRLPADSPFVQGLQQLKQTMLTSREVDLDGYRFGLIQRVRLVPRGLEDVEILGAVHRLRRVDEEVEDATGHAKNRYWVDPVDGFIWKSEQTLPGGLVLTLTGLKPYRGSHAKTP